MFSSSGTSTVEERLHVQPWTEEELQAALDAPLPEGWRAVKDEQGGGHVDLYYWNEETFESSVEKPEL